MINILLSHVRFLKKLQIFLMLLGMQSHPYQNLHQNIFSQVVKKFGQKLAEPTSQNDFDFDLFLLLVGGGCILSIYPCRPLRTYSYTHLAYNVISACLIVW